MRRLILLAVASVIVALIGLVSVSDVGRGSARAAGIGDASASVRVGFVRNGSVYTVFPDGHGTTLVLKAHRYPNPNAVDYAEPAWSPDGQHLAVHANTYESHELRHIWVFDRNMRHVATFDSDLGAGGANPSWSPDGKRLAFGDFTGGWIYVATLATGRVRDLTTHWGTGPVDYTPSWSPRGTTIAFSRNAQLYLVQPNGKSLHRLSNQIAGAVNPAWSPDGAAIAFNDYHRIGVISANGRNLRYLLTSTKPPAWTPDGTMLAFLRYPAWSPDGTTIAYQRGKDIWLYRLADKSSRLLVKNAADPTWTNG